MKNTIIRIITLLCAAAMCLPLLASCAMPQFEGDLRERYDYDLRDYLNVGQYKGLKVYIGSEEVTKREIDALILRNRSYYPAEGDWFTVEDDTPAEHGNIVGVRYTATLDGEELTDMKNVKGDGYSIVLGSDMIFEGIDEQIIGMKTGETKTFDIKVPEPCFAYPAYAGKTITFSATVSYIQTFTLAPYDEEFAANFGSDSIESFEAEIIRQLKESRTEKVDNYVLLRSLLQIKENFSVKQYPEKELAEVRERMLESTEKEAEKDSLSLEEYVAAHDLTMDEFNANLDEQAKECVFEEMIMYYIARKEQLALTDAEFEERAEEKAEENSLSSVEQYISFMYYLSGYSEYDVREEIWFDMVYEFLADNTVRVTD